MRTVVAIPVAVLTSFLVTVPAAAEKRTESRETIPVAPVLPEPAPGFALDTSDLADLFTGSPVAIRHLRVTKKLRARSKKVRRDAAVFRSTQTGQFDETIADAAAEWGLDPFLLKGLLYNESRLDPKLVGKRIYKKVDGKRVSVGGGARGIAQFTGDGVAAVNEAREKRQRRGERVRAFNSEDVWVPERAIPAAAELLASYIHRFGRDGGVTAYNSGPYGGRMVKKHGFWDSRSRLRRVGKTHIQGHRFLLNVLRRTNQFRKKAGIDRLKRPKKRHTAPKRRSERPNS